MKFKIHFMSHKEVGLHKQIRKWLTEQGINRGKTFYMSKPRVSPATKMVSFYVDLDDESIATMMKLAFSEHVKPA